MPTLGDKPTPAALTDHDLLLGLHEQVYALQKEIRALHRLMQAMKKGLAPRQPTGSLTETIVDLPTLLTKQGDPIWDLEAAE